MRLSNNEINERDEDVPPATAVNTARLEALTRSILRDYDLSPSVRADDAIASFELREAEYRFDNRKPTVQERMADCEARAYIRVRNARMSDRAKDMTCDEIRELARAVYFKHGRFDDECLSEFRMKIKGLLRRKCPVR